MPKNLHMSKKVVPLQPQCCKAKAAGSNSVKVVTYKAFVDACFDDLETSQLSETFDQGNATTDAYA